MQFTYRGRTIEGTEAVGHRLVSTVTDLTKTIDGVRTVVVWDRDFSAGELVEAEIAFFAQDDAGNVWELGEHPEAYEDGKIVESPTWIQGIDRAQAGISMKAAPRPGTPSYSLGLGPAVGFTDRARVLKVGDRTCIPSRCFSGVLLVDEFNPDQPGKHQLKYYAPGVGNVRVGWSGANEDSKETLVLVALERLGARAMAKARREALKLEASAYRTSKSIYGRTAPSEPAGVQTGSLGWARLASRSSLRGGSQSRFAATSRSHRDHRSRDLAAAAAARHEDRGDPPGRQDRPHAVAARRAEGRDRQPLAPAGGLRGPPGHLACALRRAALRALGDLVRRRPRVTLALLQNSYRVGLGLVSARNARCRAFPAGSAPPCHGRAAGSRAARQRRCDHLAVGARRQSAPAFDGRPPDRHRAPHRPSGRVSRADPGRAARAPATARAPRRLRPPDGVAPLERSRLHRSHPRPRGLHRLGLRARRRVPAEQGDLDDAGRRHLPGNGDRHGRDGAVHRRRGHLARGGTPQSPVRVVVRRASAGLRGDRAFLVPRDTDRQRARPEPRRRRLLARAVHRNDRRAGALEGADPHRSRASLPPARGRGHGGRTRSRVAAHHGAQPRAHGRQLRAVLPLALPHPAFLGHGTPVLALGGTERAARFASR